ncbi:acyltransferase [Solwaraspora sp. WMMD406]|uniref:acyltransferase family protein n=1 Tax=Solwaraspora sp. WMMD406 TaxID=3016095 RepID=UPI0024171135|nr:acyltransferase [Solwaraspora sp. WMMD406]MDG4766874.1 acyltransferase [Solwaraspora sp. WMMD406]
MRVSPPLRDNEQETSAQFAAPTRIRERSPYIDALRALAILRVYLLHALWLTWLPTVFPAMPVMFALAGYLTAVSLERGAPLRVVGSRLRRLLPPLWALAVVAVPLMILVGWRPSLPDVTWWVAPLRNPPSSEWGGPFSLGLWYIRAYLWLVLLSPPLWWAFRRWPAGALLTLATFAVVFASPLVELPVNPVTDVIWSTAAYGSCWLIGYARHTGLLDRVPLRWYVLGVGALALGAMMWLSDRGEDDQLGALVWGWAVVLLLMRARPRLDWLAQVPWLARLIRRINARAVTIYVWHLPVLWAAAALLNLAGLYAGKSTILGVGTVLLVAVVLALGWVEDLAARRRPSLLPPG